MFRKLLLVAMAMTCFSLAFYISTHKRSSDAVDLYIQLIEEQTPLNDDEKRVVLANLNYASTHFSPHIVSYLGKSVRVAKEWGNSKHTTVFSGFEDLGVDNGGLVKLWSQEYYPKNWIKNNIKSIKFQKTPKTFEEDKLYGLNWQKSGEAGDFTHSITIFGYGLDSGKDVIRKNLDWVFSHELGHRNDWINAQYLTPKERLELLIEVTESFSRANRFVPMGDYIQSITDVDPQKQNYYRMREWWASICEYYFTFPNLLIKESQRDFLLVDRWVKKRDPGYDTFLMESEREKLLKKEVWR